MVGNTPQKATADNGYGAEYIRHLFCGGIIVTVILQGGFYPGTFLVAAIFFTAILMTARRMPLRKSTITLCALAGWYLVAAMKDGWDFSTVAQACLPGAVVVALCCAEQLTKKQRVEALHTLTTVSAMLALVGIMAFENIVPISSAVTARRLQFPFQYVNAAGSWYAAMSLLAQWDREETARSWPLIFLQSALFLTRSMGACGLYVIAEVGYIFHRRTESDRWQAILITNEVSACFAAGFYLSSNLLVSASLCILLTVTAFFLPRLLRVGQKFRLHWGTLIGAFALMALMGGGRFTRSLATFAERLYQIKDGLRIAANYPVFGVGAGNWAYVYPSFQSAEYASTVVHSGPVQVAVDAGFLALLLLVAFFILALRSGKRPFPVTLAALLLSVHGIFDFNFCFFPLAVLAGFLLLFGSNANAAAYSPVQNTMQKVILLAFILLCAALLIGIWQSKQISTAVQQKNWGSALEQYDAYKGWLGNSRPAKSAAASAATQLGQWDRVLALTESNSERTVQQILLRAGALRMTRGEEAGCQYLLDELEQRPYQVSFYENTAHLLKQWHADAELRNRYNMLANQFNQSENILTHLQRSARVYIYKI